MDLLICNLTSNLRQVTCIVRERQLRLYGHVARLPAEDPAHRILSCRDGQTEAEGVPWQGGRGDALLRRTPPYLTWMLSHSRIEDYGNSPGN